jgi:hypothetical protein
MKSTDKAGVQFPDSESILLPFVASICAVGVVAMSVAAKQVFIVDPVATSRNLDPRLPRYARDGQEGCKGSIRHEVYDLFVLLC